MTNLSVWVLLLPLLGFIILGMTWQVTVTHGILASRGERVGWPFSVPLSAFFPCSARHLNRHACRSDALYLGGFRHFPIELWPAL